MVPSKDQYNVIQGTCDPFLISRSVEFLSKCESVGRNIELRKTNCTGYKHASFLSKSKTEIHAPVPVGSRKSFEI